MRSTFRAEFLRARKSRYKTQDLWTICLLFDGRKELHMSVLARNAPPDIVFPPKHTVVEIDFNILMKREQPPAVRTR